MKISTSSTSETTDTEKDQRIDFSALNESISNNFEKILLYYGIDYKIYSNRFAFKCPIHESSKPESANVFTSGNSKYGNFICWTSSCHEETGRGVVNLVKFLLEEELKRKISFSEVVRILKERFSIDSPLISNQVSENRKFSNFVLNNDVRDEQFVCTRNSVVRSLKIPSEYFLKRGYSKKVLEEFDVGYCSNFGKKMYMRTVAPVYSVKNNSHMIGCVGRSLFEECGICGYYHSPTRICPSNRVEESWCHKWINSDNFRTSNCLYGLWKNYDLCNSTSKIILVEGQGDVWRLYEAGIRNAVGLFGSKLSYGQKLLLDKIGVTDVYLSLDRDKAGMSATEKILEELKDYFNLHIIEYPYKDVGEIPLKEVTNYFYKAGES